MIISGRLEGWKGGRVEDWGKVGRVEEWKDCRLFCLNRANYIDGAEDAEVTEGVLGQSSIGVNLRKLRRSDESL